MPPATAVLVPALLAATVTGTALEASSFHVLLVIEVDRLIDDLLGERCALFP